MSKKQYALNYLLASQWAITEPTLELMAEIAEREHEFAGNLQALEAKLGRPLGNTMAATIRDGVALIPVEGPMFHRAGFFQSMSGATDYAGLAQDLGTALDDPSVQAIMLLVNSPGGETSGLSDLAAMVRGAKKPVWAHVDGMGASAAYWLAASVTGRLTASSTAVLGSVGAQMGMTMREPRPGEKSYRFVSSQSPLKNASPDTEAGAQAIQTMVNDLAQVFIDAVSEYRGTTADEVVKNFGSGAMMIASKAADAGMIDSVSTFEDAFAALLQELNTMDFASLTAQALAENRPDLVASLRAEGVASVATVDAAAVRAEATAAERQRIVAVEALAMPGAESIIAACKADGTDPAQAAVKIVQHMRSTQASAGAAAMAHIQAAETSMTPPTASSGDDLTAEQRLAADMAALRKSGVIR